MLSKFLGRYGAALRMFSGAIGIQAMLSASAFLVGLLLVRRTSDAQYGDYVLITTTMALLTSLQYSFIGPPMIIRLTQADLTGRGNLIGGLARDQNRLMPLLVLAPIVLGVIAQLRGELDWTLALTLLTATAATVTSMTRNYWRTVLFSYRRPNDVLGADAVYCVLLVAGAYAATFTRAAAATAALTLAISCVAGNYFLRRALWKHEPWNPEAPLGMLRVIAPLGAWSAFGSGVHWAFSQGYNYLVAGELGVTAVAALAATRLLVMPVNLLSTGVASLMLPLTSGWMQHYSAPKVFMRLTLASLGLAGLACVYLLIMWLARDWIFRDVLTKKLADSDLLLSMWCAISVVMLFRDQLLHFLVARAKFRVTSSITLTSAVISVCSSLLAMHYLGVVGALAGLLLGEVVNVGGILAFSLRESRAAMTSASAARIASTD